MLRALWMSTTLFGEFLAAQKILALVVSWPTAMSKIQTMLDRRDLLVGLASQDSPESPVWITGCEAGILTRKTDAFVRGNIRDALAPPL